MAFRLADLVLRGEIDNTRRNSVRGWLAFQGTEKNVVLSLTGDCSPDLAGRHFRFTPRNPPQDLVQGGDEDEAEEARLARLGLAGWAWQQIGPTGEMTAARKVRTPDCPEREMLRRLEAGEPIGPTEWKRCLYLEWYSQNGRVVIELADPHIEFVSYAGEGQAEPWDAEADPDEPADAGGEAGLNITAIEINEEGEAETHEVFGSDPDRPEDEYGLFPDDLQDHLDEQARMTDRTLRDSVLDDDEVKDDVTRELELMDDLIADGEGELLGSIFEGVVELPSPDSLDEQEAEQHLKAALGRMALFGIALNICEHYTTKDAYRLLVEDLCREQCFFPELEGTNWVQHFDTSEFCDACRAEFEAGEEEP